MKKEKRMPVWGMITLDILLTAAAIGAFMLFDYVMPQTDGSNGTVVAQIDSESDNSFALPSDLSSQTSESSTADTTDNETSQSDSQTTEKSEKKVDTNNNGNKYSKVGTDGYDADNNAINKIFNSEVTENVIGHSVQSDSEITVTQKSIGEGSDKITYYVADVYVTNVGAIKTAFAQNTFGKNIKETISDMAESNNAIFAINGDFYGNSESGVVIRNGVKYRDTLNDADVCVLFTDGTMKTYSYDEIDVDAVIEQGAWQAWNFGPALLDGEGNVLSQFNTTKYLNSRNPRSAIGYVAPGHYVFVTVDGRDEGYSKGVTISELAAIMADEGCLTAFNLDGGKSAEMYYDGSTVNQPDGGGRKSSDIIYIGE